MITYELAKKLKESGFDQREDLFLCAEDLHGLILRDLVSSLQREGVGVHKTFDYSIYPIPEPDDWTQGKARLSAYFSKEYLDSEEGKKYTVYIPTLEELIKACGTKFGSVFPYYFLEKGDDWRAVSRIDNKYVDQTVGKGKTPEEAVANLWLELDNGKPHGKSK